MGRISWMLSIHDLGTSARSSKEGVVGGVVVVKEMVFV